MEPMKRCPQCQAEIPAKAYRCSHCGKKIGMSPMGKVIAVLFIIMVAAMVLL